MNHKKSSLVLCSVILSLIIIGGSGEAGWAQVTPAVSVVWQNDVNVTINGTSITKINSGSYDGGAISTQSVAVGHDVFVQTTILETNTDRFIGLSNMDSNQYWADIKHAIRLASDGNLRVYENGAHVALVGTYVTGDIIKVGIESNIVKYYKNDLGIYTSLTAPVYPIIVDTSLKHINATLSNVQISGTLDAGLAGDIIDLESWRSEVETAVDDFLDTYFSISSIDIDMAFTNIGDYITNLSDNFTTLNATQTTQQTQLDALPEILVKIRADTNEPSCSLNELEFTDWCPDGIGMGFNIPDLDVATTSMVVTSLKDNSDNTTCSVANIEDEEFFVLCSGAAPVNGSKLHYAILN